MLKRQGNLFVVSGPSGAGKGSIIKELIKQRRDIWVSVSATSRDPRDGEQEAISYFFKTKQEFRRLIDQQAFLEWAQVFRNYYGTLREPVLEALKKGVNVILEIDIQGALQIKEMYQEAIFVFILPPSLEELENRIIHRGSETPESLALRLKTALEEIAYIEKYDYFIINDDLADSTAKLDAIITAENAKVAQDVVALLEQADKGFMLG
ncbi:MAG TPA: guanylate kinase [Tissierellia bacterium]|nr:guanylate kinase [Tissierellia bacterium]